MKCWPTPATGADAYCVIATGKIDGSYGAIWIVPGALVACIGKYSPMGALDNGCCTESVGLRYLLGSTV